MHMKKDTSSCKHCPYWLADSRKCLISRKGLFIPLEKHIATYCTTPKHTQCHLYRDELLLQQSAQQPANHNRRKYNRFPSGKKLTLHQITDTGTIGDGTSKIAFTTNLSDGGIQIRTKNPLFHGALVSLSYEQTAKSSRKKRLAKVVWCQYEKDSLIYLAGLRFQKEIHRESGAYKI